MPKVSLVVLCSVPFVMVLSNSMLIPVLPATQKALHITPFQVGLIITAFSVPAGIIIPLGGYLSDRLGRKVVMIPALFLFGLGGLLAGLAALLMAKPFWGVLGARVVQGIGGGGLYQVAMALAGDTFDAAERPRALGILEAANGLGKVVAPIIGAAAALLVWFAPYWVYPILAWPAALLVWFLVKEPKKEAAKNQSPGQYLAGLKETWEAKGIGLLTAFAAGMVALFLLFGILSYYSDILESRWNIRGFVKGFVMAIPVLVMMITTYLTGIALQSQATRLGKPLLLAGLGLVASGLASLFFLKGLYLFTVGMSVLGLGAGLMLPALNNMVTSAVGAAGRGIVTSLYGTVRFFGAALGPPVAGRLSDAGAGPITLGGAALAGLTAILALFLIDNKRLSPQGTPSEGGKSGG